MIVRAPGYQTVATHIFDRASEYLESDTVFAVKSSLLRTFEERGADPDRGFDGPWCSLECTLLLAPGLAHEPADPGRTA
jgi:hydroxyquinol 1,2-dioxygenase